MSTGEWGSGWMGTCEIERCSLWQDLSFTTAPYLCRVPGSQETAGPIALPVSLHEGSSLCLHRYTTQDNPGLCSERVGKEASLPANQQSLKGMMSRRGVLPAPHLGAE